MKISNKLSTKDFVDLQKILFEEHNISPALKFMLKWVYSLLYGLAAFIIVYLILNYLSYPNFYIAGLVAILVFILLLVFYPKRTKRKMDRIIERYYGSENLDQVRETQISESGLSYMDKGAKKTYNFVDLKYYRLIDDKLFLIFPNETGTIVNLQDLSLEDRDRIISYVEKYKGE